MSSCQGELPETQFQVRAVDHEAKVLYEGSLDTLKNGFFELWLPRNRIVTLEVRGLNRSAGGTIGTFRNSDTCITTFQLR